MFPRTSTVRDRAAQPASVPSARARHQPRVAATPTASLPAKHRGLRHLFNLAIAFVTLDAVWLGEDDAQSAAPRRHPHRSVIAARPHERRAGAVAAREAVCLCAAARNDPAAR